MRDQMCYTVNPNEYKHEIDLKGELSLALFIHYNEDRQMENIDTYDEHSIIVDTTGNFFLHNLELYRWYYRAIRTWSGEDLFSECYQGNHSHRFFSINGQKY